MTVELRPFDPADHLQSEEDIFYFLEAAMEGNDPAHIARALGVVARSKGMTEIARMTRDEDDKSGAKNSKEAGTMNGKEGGAKIASSEPTDATPKLEPRPAGERSGKRQSALAENLKKWLKGRSD